MMISRSIVDRIRKELNPPGRFLEKDSDGIWFEVQTKKALEKTAQALRDGAFPLKKEMQLSEDFSDAAFLSAVFDEQDGDFLLGSNVNEAKVPKAASHPLKQKGHRRRVSAPVIQQVVLPELDDLPDPKRSRPNNLSSELNNSLTGINFPSPGVNQDNIEFLIGSNDVGSKSSVKKHHRRNRTFGGYSCSDKNVSDMHIDDIFALFMGNSGKTDSQQQHNQGQSNGNTNNIGHHERQQSAENLNAFGLGHQDQSVGGMNATLDQLFSNSSSQQVDNGQSNENANTFNLNQHNMMDVNASSTQPFSIMTQNQQPCMNSALNNNASTFNFDQNQANQNAIDVNASLMQQLSYMNSASNNNANTFIDQNQANQNTIDVNASSMQMLSNVNANQLSFMASSSNNNANTFSFDQNQANHNGNNMNASSTQMFSCMAPNQQTFMASVSNNNASAFNFNQNQGSQNANLLSNMALTQQSYTPNASNNNDMMQYSPQGSPSLEIPPFQGQQQQNQGLSELNLMTSLPNTATNTLSGTKRHRRYNTIANGHCFSGHQMSNAAPAPTAASSNLADFNLDFLNNINPEPISNSLNNNQLSGVAQNPELQIYDSSDIESYVLPLKDPAPSRGRHRRVNTTGNIGLPQDFNFSLNQPSMLNTIDEEATHFPLTHECGSLMSSKDETGGSSKNDSDSKPSHQKAPSFSSTNASVPSTVHHGHTRDTSSKSSLSNEDFCIHLMAAGNWEGMNDGEDDGLMISENNRGED